MIVKKTSDVGPKTPISDHFDGVEFHNLYGAPAGRSLLDVLRWKFLGGRAARWPEHPGAAALTPDLPTDVEAGNVAATFVGHSTFLLQFAGGLNLLTDPIWSDRASPVSFAGPRRARPPALAFESLPPISLVLVSHGHYDHMDVPTLVRLEERFAPLFLTGLGQGKVLRKHGLKRVAELDWWQSSDISAPVANGDPAALTVTYTPAQHWSARGVTGRNRALWGGFWLRHGSLNVFFAADTGLGRHFSLIRERMGRPDVAFLPIGAYEPRWFMREQHMNPDDAVQAHIALESRSSVSMHFGTFQLTDEAIDEPARALRNSQVARRVAPAAFHVPAFGETLRFSAGEAVPKGEPARASQTASRNKAAR